MRIATLTLIALAAGASFLSGCGTSQRSGLADPTALTLTGIRLDSSGDSHIIVFTAPSGGWSLSADGMAGSLGKAGVNVTLRRPNPAFLHPQMLTEHRIATEIDSSTRLSVWARILEHDEPAGHGGYSLAAESD